VLCCVADAQFTPQWNVGDWWIVNEQGESTRDDSGWVWQPRRYDVLDTEGVDGHDCYVLQEKLVDTTAAQEGVRDLYYVRTDDWKIVRRVEYFTRAGKLIGPSAADYPQGMFGTRRGELRMPVFPLDTTYVQDSAFGVYEFPIGSAYLRQFSGLADSVLLSLYLSQPDTSGGYPVQLGEEELQALNATADRLECSRAEAIREAILHYAEYVKGLEVIKIREVSKEQARREVLAYLKEKDRAWSSEIADSLRLDITLVDDVLAELWGEGEVEPNA